LYTQSTKLLKMNTNNRFNVLLENNNNNNNKTKIVKNNEPKSATFNNFRSNNYINNRHQDEVDYRKFKEEKLKKQKEEDIVKALNISNFPDLKSVSSSNIDTNYKAKTDKTSFADMMKSTTQIVDTLNTVTSEEVEVEIVKPGCICIKQDAKTNQLIWIYGDGCLEINKNNENDNSDNLAVDEHPFYVFERLKTLYNNRKNEYINKWGYDEYDKMFLFQNYDYEYFDKLDENFGYEISNHYYKSNNNDYDYDYYMDN